MLFLATLTAGLFTGAYCRDEGDACDYDAYRPHRCGVPFRTTPGGHEVCDDPKDSVAAGYVTEQEIDAAVDGQFAAFYATFPEFSGLLASVQITDDYVFWTGQQWAAGLACGPGCGTVYVALWTRATSAKEPSTSGGGGVWIKRPPVHPCATYDHWRYTARPWLPALPHELLHEAIGDPWHQDARWQMLPGPCAACFPGAL